ncbi:Ribosomal protein S12 methylthiotransferase RimO [Candidatus Desulfarcum epimagneticum]|uniref:Ribosomal protein uS12 methylthiotransferase RimO n=1 Tax=uncultured Desulfobacteraceae bacterium TaxID=218296 RepID=A0A484HGL5_9BACT|nr:Ribosomal protein S12 methylthiotransferase RimO [uncultured Desulfobacteraceae bacterium]
MSLYLLSLGCPRNQVDSELMMGALSEAGIEMAHEPDEAEIILVNTCAFIEAAVNESLDVIFEMAALKKSGACRLLVVAGCLPERFGPDLASKLPEADIFLGTGAYDRVVEAVLNPNDFPKSLLPDPSLSSHHRRISPRRLTDTHTAYLRVAEGCARRCSYCVIPKLRGEVRSRPFEEIMEEARFLADSGVKEIILAAQDTTAYGRDLGEKSEFARLISSVSRVSEGIRTRFLYGHPGSIDLAAIQAVADGPGICPYFDLPIQHASDPVLKRMGRPYRREDLLKLFDSIRTLVPDAALRTSIMTGFPGETDRDFQILFDFINEVEFDHAGVFVYSDFDDLPSHRLPDPVPAKISKERHDALMARQRTISRKKNETYLEKTIEVLIETKVEDGVWQGRAPFQAPDVDGIVYAHGRRLEIGVFRDVEITDTLDYDLVGEAL